MKRISIIAAVVAIETKLGNGIESTLQELKQLIVAHGEKLQKLELSLSADGSKYESIERRLTKLEEKPNLGPQGGSFHQGG